MIELFLIFALLVGTPIILSMPFYAYNRYRDLKDEEALDIIDKLKGINRHKVDWPGPP